MADFEYLSNDLRGALDEFFAPNTQNERKREIEQALLSFQTDYDRTLPFVIQLLTHSTHQYSLMFALHVLQGAVNTRWLAMSPEAKVQIRECCGSNLLRLSSTQPRFISNKLMKLLADIGRMDWPQFYPNFFSQILQWIFSQDHTTLGLKALKISLEEFTNAFFNTSGFPPEDCLLLSSDQREAQKRHLLQETEQRLLPSLLCLHQSIFEQYATELCVNLTPEQASSVEWTSFAKDTCSHMQELPRLSNSYETCYLALECLAHFVQFCHLDTLINTPKLLDYLFAWSYFGCRPTKSSPRSFPSNSIEMGDDELCTVAVSGLVELAGRHFVTVTSTMAVVPGQHQQSLARLHLFQFLDVLLAELSTLPGVTADTLAKKMSILSHSWLGKIVELLRLFFTHHFHRYDSTNSVSPDAIRDFLSRVWTFTESLPTVELFQNALEIWHVFFDYLHAQLDDRKAVQASQIMSQKYSHLFDAIISALLRKISTEDNGLDLVDSMDIQLCDVNDDSDWSHYLFVCCDLLAKIADLYPLATFLTLRASFDSRLATFVRFQYQASHPETVIRQFQDLQALLVAAGRLSHLFISETFWKYLDDCKAFVNRLCEGITYCSKCQYYKSDDAPTQLREEFSHVYAQLLLCFRSYCHWLAELYSEAQRLGEYNAEATMIISTVMDAIVPVLETSTPNRLLHAAVSTLYSVMITVRPQSYLLCTESAKKLYAKACQLEYASLPPKVFRVLHGSLCNYLILPWFNAINYEQEWEKRKPMYQKLIRALLRDYDLLCQMQQNPTVTSSVASWTDEKVKKTVQDASELVIEMLESISNESTKTKQLCFGAMKHIIDGTLKLVGAAIDRLHLLEPLLALLSAAFNSLMVQLGPEFTKETVERLLQLCQTDQFKNIQGNETSASGKVLEHILKILHCIVKETSRAFAVFSDSILTLLFCHIHPVIGHIDSVDVKQAFYGVLYLFMDVRWRYFFVTNVLMTMESQDIRDKTDHTEALMAIMQAFGESLTDNDPSLIKQNLAYLNSLNSKWSLYQRVVFVMKLYPHFAQVLLRLLSDRQHLILSDDFIETLSHMVCASDCNLCSFRNEIVPQFLRELGSIQAGQIDVLMQKEKFTKEVPTFALELRRFLNDVVMYRTCNAAIST